jgi:ribosomal protein S18 acetylase RimI-like enzyme
MKVQHVTNRMTKLVDHVVLGIGQQPAGARCFGVPADEARAETAEHLNEPGSRMYLAFVDDVPIGVVGALTEQRGVYIRGLGVLPEHQGRGYGRAILARTIALYVAEGHRHLALDVATENRNALALYQSCGFVETNRYDYYEVDLSRR